MRPLAYTFPYSIFFWMIFVWAFWPEFLLIVRRRPQATVVEANSHRVLTLGLSLAFAGAFSIAAAPALRWSPPVAELAFCSGLVLLISGSLLRRHCWRVLGKHFTGYVAVQTDQPVIATGAYALVRHPSYSGALLMNIGIGIALGNWASSAVLLIASLALYGYRIAVEEKILLANIGEPYRVYMAGRKRLVPYVY